VKAREAFQRALEIDPDDVTTNFWLATQLVSDGYLRKGAERLDKVLRIDPIHPNALFWRGVTAFRQGDAELADRLLRRARDLGLGHVGMGLSELSDARGNREEAAEQLTEGMKVLGADLPADAVAAMARGAYGDMRARDTALASVDQYLATRPKVLAAIAPYALIRLGRTREGLDLFASRPTGNDAMIFPMLWGPYGREARQSPAFAEFARRTGLVEVWDLEGPPDLCRRTGAGAYDCR
jgi:tetratricopeptide (TPR) repeat protein